MDNFKFSSVLRGLRPDLRTQDGYKDEFRPKDKPFMTQITPIATLKLPGTANIHFKSPGKGGPASTTSHTGKLKS